MIPLKCAVLVADYPSQSHPYRLMYVHTRVLGYRPLFDVQVFSFGATAPYEYESIEVRPVGRNSSFEGFDVVVVHAPVKPHLEALEMYNGPLVVFIHGFEALKVAKYYPRPYAWRRLARFVWCFKPIRDFMKLRKLRRFLLARADTIQVVTVSQWMRKHMLACLRLLEPPPFPTAVIPNAVNPVFESREYNWNSAKHWDFISIRPLDHPKYGTDIIVKCAERNPDLSFLLVGEGKYFEHMPCPPNLEVRSSFLRPAEIPELLDASCAALMPTRLDAQGVMACELAQYGIPLVSSDIEICREVLAGYPQVNLFSNAEMPDRLAGFLAARRPAEREPLAMFSAARTLVEEQRVIRDHVEAVKARHR